MPHRFRITTTNNAAGDTETQTGEFSDVDWAILSQYLDCSDRLARCRIVESQAKLRLRIRGELGKPTTLEATLPPDEDVDQFLHRLRPFVLHDATNFYDVRSVLGRYITLPAFRQYLKRLGDRYAGKDIPFRIVVGSEAGELMLGSKEAVDKWLNAFEYHQDSGKQTELRSMYAVFPEQASRGMFLYFLLQRAGAIGKLGALIDGFSKRDGRTVQVR